MFVCFRSLRFSQIPGIPIRPRLLRSATTPLSMARSAKLSTRPSSDLESFRAYLKSSDRVMALAGAGLSASSGLPTFRGAGGLWRNEDAMSLATPEAFNADPAKVWLFYSYRRHMALKAEPNKAHKALAELARKKEDFLMLSQNVDGLSQRANHPVDKLHLLHGSLFSVRCTNFYCDYHNDSDFSDPIVPALSIPTKEEPTPSPSIDKVGAEATKSLYEAMESKSQELAEELDISDESVPIPKVGIRQLPHCPKCKDGILRPGVVWFGEPIPGDVINAVDTWIGKNNKVDLLLVIGTSCQVYPAASYIDAAREYGARVAVVNIDEADVLEGGFKFRKGDWFFQGDAGQLVPEILSDIVEI